MLVVGGEDATIDATVAAAAGSGRSELIKPLLDAGADVNMRDGYGRTALHLACSWYNYSTFFELLRWAEDDIDWNARTPYGQNALHLFDLSISNGFTAHLSQSQIDEIHAVLRAHINNVEG